MEKGNFEGEGAGSGYARTCQTVDVLRATQQGGTPRRYGADADWGVVYR